MLNADVTAKGTRPVVPTPADYWKSQVSFPRRQARHSNSITPEGLGSCAIKSPQVILINS